MSQPAQLAAWQTERRQRKREAVRHAIRRLDARGVAINFSIVAAEAGVDRSWLYSQQDLALEIRCLRGQTNGLLVLRPQRERASDASLRARLAAAHQALSDARQKISELHTQLQAAREELARVRGERWEQQPP
ncbi:MAG: DUF6262 family protein [Actinobacteria bacterium]|nr:DUF6262 family protein [Actinomycetota bacterium]